MTVAPAASDIVFLDARQLSETIHARAVSCVEVMTAYLDHIERVNPQVNAIVSIEPREALLRQARERDEALGRGESLGWMHGMPQAVPCRRRDPRYGGLSGSCRPVACARWDTLM